MVWGHTVRRGAGKFPFELELGRKEVWGAEKYLVSGRRGLVRREETGGGMGRADERR